MRTILAALILLLAGCAAPPTTTQASGPTGWVVLSMLTELAYSPATLTIRPMGSGDDRIVGLVAMDGLTGKMHKFGETWGVVKTAAVAPGTYEIVNFHLELAGRTRYRSRQDFALRFEVKANEVAYLGQFVATRTRVKSLVDWISGPTPYFIVTDHRARDVAEAAKATPELQGLPSRTVAFTPVKATPLIRSSRVE